MTIAPEPMEIDCCVLILGLPISITCNSYVGDGA